MIRILIAMALLMVSGAAQAQELNQCRSLSSCASIATDDVQGGPFDADGTESFVTRLDIDGTLSLDRCSWEWQVFYDPTIVSPDGFSPDYSPAFGVIQCAAAPATAPPFFPNNTAQVVCAMTKTGPGPPSFAPSFSDVSLFWDVLEGPDDADSVIVAGAYTFSTDTFGPCLTVDSGSMVTDLEFSVVPEPGLAMALWPGVLVLLMLSGSARALEPEEMEQVVEELEACQELEEPAERDACTADVRESWGLGEE